MWGWWAEDGPHSVYTLARKSEHVTGNGRFIPLGYRTYVALQNGKIGKDSAELQGILIRGFLARLRYRLFGPTKCPFWVVR